MMKGKRGLRIGVSVRISESIRNQKELSEPLLRPTWTLPVRASVWLSLSLFLTFVFALSDWIVLNHVRPFYLLVLGALCSLLWISVAPFIQKLTQWFAVGPPLNRLAIFIHFVLCLLMSMVCTLGFAAMIWLVDPWLGQPEQTFMAAFRSATFYFLLANALFYWLVVTVQTVMDRSTQVQKYQVRSAKMERELTLSRMNVLQMQMQPHFLFNSLNSVSSLIRLSDDQSALEAVARLGEVLRASLSSDEVSQATLGEELELLEKYVELERIRFPDRLKFLIDATQESKKLKIPRWILQPFVENAIRHGIEARPDSGLISLSARRKGEHLVIKISDDGIGFDRSREEGIGIRNTRERLTELFGADFEMSIESLNGGGDASGTRVTLRLPVGETGRG